MTSWYSSVVQHTSGDELSNYIAADMIKAVRHWAKVNNGKQVIRRKKKCKLAVGPCYFFGSIFEFFFFLKTKRT